MGQTERICVSKMPRVESKCRDFADVSSAVTSFTENLKINFFQSDLPTPIVWNIDVDGDPRQWRKQNTSLPSSPQVDQLLPLKPKPISLDELKRQRLQSNAESSPTKKIKITDEKDTAPSPRSPQGECQIHFLVFESIDSQASSLRKKRIQSYLEKVFVCPHISQKYFVL